VIEYFRVASLMPVSNLLRSRRVAARPRVS
jgi:hypothetical protein